MKSIVKKILKKYKFSFTLIELLAIIVLLAVIALIATPMILDAVEDARNSADMSSAQLIANSGHNYYASSLLDESKKEKIINGINIYPDIMINNKPENGQLYVNENNEVAIAIIINNKCYKKTYDSEIEVVDVNDCDLGYMGPDDINPNVNQKVLNTTINENGWYKEDLYVKIEVTDNESGPAGYRRCMGQNKCDPDETIYDLDEKILVSSESANNYICVVGIDNKGNESEKNCEIYKLDKTTPTLSLKNSNIEITEDDSIDVADYFEVNYGISGGNMNCNPINTSNMTIGNNFVSCTANGNNGLSSSLSTNINVKTSTFLDNKTYNPGDIVEYLGLKWKVISNESKQVTLILASNYTTGSYGSNTTFEGSTIYNYLNNNFVNSTRVGEAIANKSLVAQGNNYYVRIAKVDELSNKISLDDSTNGSLFWTLSSTSSKLYLGDSTGSKAVAYFTEENRGTQNLYTHQYSDYLTIFGGNGSYSVVAYGNTWYKSNSATDLIASPSVTNISYYNSSSSFSGVGCSDLKTVTVVGCYADWSSSGRATWYYGPYNSSGTTSSLDNYLDKYQLSDSRSQNICVGSSTVRVYYATYYTQCELPFITSSSNYRSVNVNMATNQIYYYQPSGSQTNATIGYRPVITVLKKNI